MIRNIIFITAFLISGTLFAQTETDSAKYNKGIDMLHNAQTTAAFLQVAECFDTLSKDIPGQWLVHYYSGLAYVLAGQKGSNKKYMDQLLDKAQKRVDKSYALKPDEPEIHILQAFLYQVRLLVDPQARAITFAQKAETMLKKAIAADPGNPRAYFLMGNNIYYTPPVFKGGPKNALPVFLKAREKFKGYEAELSFMPDWGDAQNEEMIHLCNQAKN
jgi:tetratricopeptide (TPR) repeat protein